MPHLYKYGARMQALGPWDDDNSDRTQRLRRLQQQQGHCKSNKSQRNNPMALGINTECSPYNGLNSLKKHLGQSPLHSMSSQSKHLIHYQHSQKLRNYNPQTLPKFREKFGCILPAAKQIVFASDDRKKVSMPRNTEEIKQELFKRTISSFITKPKNIFQQELELLYYKRKARDTAAQNTALVSEPPPTDNKLFQDKLKFLKTTIKFLPKQGNKARRTIQNDQRDGSWMNVSILSGSRGGSEAQKSSKDLSRKKGDRKQYGAKKGLGTHAPLALGIQRKLFLMKSKQTH